MSLSDAISSSLYGTSSYNNRYAEEKRKRSEQRANRQRLNRIEKRYVVTHKVYDMYNKDIQSVCNSTVEVYGNVKRIADISYIQGSMLFLKIVKGMTALSNKFLIKNSWDALLICDIHTNTSKVISRDEILSSDILDYSYNATYTNNKTSVRITEVTNEDINEINKKVEESRRPKVAKLKVVSPEEVKKEEARKAKLINTGQKLVELMFKVNEIGIHKHHFIEIDGTRYLLYEDYTGDNYIQGYMEIVPDDMYSNRLQFYGNFLIYDEDDKKYYLDYQRYISIEVNESETNDLVNLANICKTSYCDDIGYMNEYVLSTGNNSYYISMYLDEYDGGVTIKDTDSDAKYGLTKDLKLINNNNILDTLTKLHLLCKNINKYSEEYDTNKYHMSNSIKLHTHSDGVEQCRTEYDTSIHNILKAINAYTNSDTGKQYSEEVSKLLHSDSFKDAIYYMILASKLNKK